MSSAGYADHGFGAIDPERTYEHSESSPSNGQRRERRYSLSELIATSGQKTVGAVERTIPQSIP